MLKDRDEAWNRVEALATKHPQYNLAMRRINNSTNPFITPPNVDGSPPDEENEIDQNSALTLEKIEAKANEVSGFC